MNSVIFIIWSIGDNKLQTIKISRLTIIELGIFRILQFSHYQFVNRTSKILLKIFLGNQHIYTSRSHLSLLRYVISLEKHLIFLVLEILIGHNKVVNKAMFCHNVNEVQNIWGPRDKQIIQNLKNLKVLYSEFICGLLWIVHSPNVITEQGSFSKDIIIRHKGKLGKPSLVTYYRVLFVVADKVLPT